MNINSNAWLDKTAHDQKPTSHNATVFELSLCGLPLCIDFDQDISQLLFGKPAGHLADRLANPVAAVFCLLALPGHALAVAGEHKAAPCKQVSSSSVASG